MAEQSLAHPRTFSPEGTRARALAGLALYQERGDEIENLGHGRYSVPSCSGERTYVVDLGLFHDEPGHESCPCPDFRRHKDTCKHLIAATLYRSKIQLPRSRAKREASRVCRSDTHKMLRFVNFNIYQKLLI